VSGTACCCSLLLISNPFILDRWIPHTLGTYSRGAITLLSLGPA
jgi:hypothetical protein